MAPELLISMDADELRDLARKIRDYQVTKKLSDSALAKRFPGIGSTKTYNLILNNQLSGLNLENQLNNYRSVVALVESAGDPEAEEELLSDLHGPLELRRAFFETSRKNTNARLILVEGDTGSGKTSMGKLLAKSFGLRCLWIEANSSWNDKPGALLSSILIARGLRVIPASQFDKMEAAVTALNRERICLIIDEGHHMGPNILNILKTVINRTKGEVIILALSTLWRRLERDAYEEARQLTGNRLAERIRLGLSKDQRLADIAKILKNRLNLVDEKLCAVLDQHAPQRGNLGFVREVCARARELASETCDPVTQENVIQAIQTELSRR